MNARRQGGLLMLTFAVILGLLFVRGYLTGWIGKLTAAVTSPPVKQPFNVPGGAAHEGTAAPGASLRSA